jgi:hypothetical protein
VIHPRTVILAVAAALAIGIAAAPSPAFAGPGDTPSDADMEAAKKAFLDGRKAFDAKKYDVAVEKFKESYRLSKKPTLLYNIALALELNSQKDMALFYFRKFLTDAPADDEQRPDATTRVKSLEGTLGPDAGKTDTGKTDTGKTDTGKTDTGKTDTGKTDTGKTDTGKVDTVKTPVKIKPAGTYAATDFKHRVVEEAPPGKPLDLTAVVPEDSGFAVTLYYRGSGQASFTAAQMKWRYNELVGRIPAAQMAGTSVQYYIEVKDTAGTVVTKVAKPASPNVIYLESTASSQFYPDWDPNAASTNAISTGTSEKPDTGTTTNTGGSRPIDDEDPLRRDTSEDPLSGNNNNKRVADNTNLGGGTTETPGGGGGGGGFMDVGSTKFKYMKWGTTAVGGALLATSIFFYLRAGSFSTALVDESAAHVGSTCPGDGMPPPCEFDETLSGYESTGKSAETISKVTFGIGLAVTGVAVYYWIKDLRGSGRRESKPVAGNKKNRSFVATPAIGDGVIGGAAAWSW